MRYEQPCRLRTCFQRDRDRIIHSKAFRRLKHKTQVFIAPLGDHYVTRLTHTLEVSQIARTISRALELNEDLTEAIALGHDLGHTPFGHIGEQILDELCTTGFRHNEQSLRVVDVLEKDGRGLNLTWEVRDGILKHSKGQTDIFASAWQDTDTVEAEVCRVADLIAYINHDIGDAIRASLVHEEDLPSAAVAILGHGHSERIHTMVCDIVTQSHGQANISMSPQVKMAADEMRRFLNDRVYWPSLRTADAEKARHTLHFLFDYFLKYDFEPSWTEQVPMESKERGVVDYIAGMTDLYALRMGDSLSENK